MTTLNLGRVAIVHRGVYNNSTNYKPLDLVDYGDGVYLCTSESTGNAPSNVSYWSPLFNPAAVANRTPKPFDLSSSPVDLPVGAAIADVFYITNGGTFNGVAYESPDVNGNHDGFFVASLSPLKLVNITHKLRPTDTTTVAGLTVTGAATLAGGFTANAASSVNGAFVATSVSTQRASLTASTGTGYLALTSKLGSFTQTYNISGESLTVADSVTNFILPNRFGGKIVTSTLLADSNLKRMSVSSPIQLDKGNFGFLAGAVHFDTVYFNNSTRPSIYSLETLGFNKMLTLGDKVIKQYTKGYLLGSPATGFSASRNVNNSNGVSFVFADSTNIYYYESPDFTLQSAHTRDVSIGAPSSNTKVCALTSCFQRDQGAGDGNLFVTAHLDSGNVILRGMFYKVISNNFQTPFTSTITPSTGTYTRVEVCKRHTLDSMLGVVVACFRSDNVIDFYIANVPVVGTAFSITPCGSVAGQASSYSSLTLLSDDCYLLKANFTGVGEAMLFLYNLGGNIFSSQYCSAKTAYTSLIPKAYVNNTLLLTKSGNAADAGGEYITLCDMHLTQSTYGQII